MRKGGEGGWSERSGGEILRDLGSYSEPPPLYPRPLRSATTPALRARCCALRWEAGPRDWYQAFPFLTIEDEARLQHDAAPRHAKSSFKRTRKGFHHLTEELNSSSAFGGDGGKVQGKGMVWGGRN